MTATRNALSNIPLTELRRLTGICSTAQQLVPKRLAQLDAYQALDPADRIIEAVHNGDLDIANEATSNLSNIQLDMLIQTSLDDRSVLSYLLAAPNLPKTLSVEIFEAAARQGKLPAIRQLVLARARGVNAALVAAAAANNLPIVRFLVEHGAIATEVAADVTESPDIKTYLSENSANEEDIEQLLLIAIEHHPDVAIGRLEDLIDTYYTAGENLGDIPELIDDELEE